MTYRLYIAIGGAVFRQPIPGNSWLFKTFCWSNLYKKEIQKFSFTLFFRALLGLPVQKYIIIFWFNQKNPLTNHSWNWTKDVNEKVTTKCHGARGNPRVCVNSNVIKKTPANLFKFVVKTLTLWVKGGVNPVNKGPSLWASQSLHAHASPLTACDSQLSLVPMLTVIASRKYRVLQDWSP